MATARASVADIQSVRTLQKMALLRCCGREALVYKWRTRKKGKAACTICQFVTLGEKLRVIALLQDVLYVFISLRARIWISWMLFRGDMGRNTKKWIAVVTPDFLQSGAYHENKTLTQKSEILARWANYQASVFSWLICSCTLARSNVSAVFVG